MFTSNHWSLGTNLILTYYYGMMSLLMMANIGFCVRENEKISSLQNIIGIFLNSLMSVLSFNNFDFSLMLGKIDEKKNQNRMHQSKFWRQCVYNIINAGGGLAALPLLPDLKPGLLPHAPLLPRDVDLGEGGGV